METQGAKDFLAVFTTYEVFAGCLDRRFVVSAVEGLARAAKAWAIRSAVRNDEGRSKTTNLARRLGVTEARVRQLRKQMKNER